jgi:hypothetical protein
MTLKQRRIASASRARSSRRGRRDSSAGEDHGLSSIAVALPHHRLFETHLSTNTSSSYPLSDADRRFDCSRYSLVATLTRLFLPRGRLPHDYLQFQMLDSAQALCSYLRNVLTMHATLEGLGVGSSSSPSRSALAATLVLLLKEGASHAASLSFAYLVAAKLDAEVRAWRLFADVANDVGLAIELAAPRLGGYFAVASAAANSCKAVCGVAAGATRVAISAHFSRAASREAGGAGSAAAVAEVAAKEGTQETAVTLLGLCLGALLAGALNSSHAAQWAAFTLLTVLHVLANAAAVRALSLATLSRTRAAALYDLFRERKALLSPHELRHAEPLWPVQWPGGRGERADARIRLGVPLTALSSAALAGRSSGSLETVRMALIDASDTDLFFIDKRGNEVVVAFGVDASPKTMLAGWLRAVDVGKDGGGFSSSDARVEAFLKAAHSAGWDLDTPALEDEGYRFGVKAE